MPPERHVLRLPAAQTNAPCSGAECELTVEAPWRRWRRSTSESRISLALYGSSSWRWRERSATKELASRQRSSRWPRRSTRGIARSWRSKPAFGRHPPRRHPHRSRGRLPRPLPPGRGAARVQRGQRLEPRRPDAHTFQALVYTMSNKPAAAAAALAKASAIDPGRRSSTACPANSRWPARTPKRPLRCALRCRPENPAGSRSAADPGSAPFQRVALLRQVPDVAPIFPPALYADAFALLAQGDYTAAVALFRQAIQRDPIIGDALGRERLGQGSAALRAGNVRSAIEHFRPPCPRSRIAPRRTGFWRSRCERPTSTRAASRRSGRRYA